MQYRGLDRNLSKLKSIKIVVQVILAPHFSSPDYEISVACDDILDELYVNEIKQTFDTDTAKKWNEVTTIIVELESPGELILRIKCHDIHYKYFVAASVKDVATGDIVLVSDDSWRCRSGDTEDWEEAVIIGEYFTFSGSITSADWIWAKGTSGQAVECYGGFSAACNYSTNSIKNHGPVEPCRGRREVPITCLRFVEEFWECRKVGKLIGCL